MFKNENYYSKYNREVNKISQKEQSKEYIKSQLTTDNLFCKFEVVEYNSNGYNEEMILMRTHSTEFLFMRKFNNHEVILKLEQIKCINRIF